MRLKDTCESLKLAVELNMPVKVTGYELREYTTPSNRRLTASVAANYKCNASSLPRKGGACCHIINSDPTGHRRRRWSTVLDGDGRMIKMRYIR